MCARNNEKNLANFLQLSMSRNVSSSSSKSKFSSKGNCWQLHHGRLYYGKTHLAQLFCLTVCIFYFWTISVHWIVIASWYDIFSTSLASNILINCRPPEREGFIFLQLYKKHLRVGQYKVNWFVEGSSWNPGSLSQVVLIRRRSFWKQLKSHQQPHHRTT